MSVLLETTLGNLVIDLHLKECPTECENFLNLCQIQYYKYAPFVNLQKNYTVEIADPMFPLRKTGCSIWSFIRENSTIEIDFETKDPVDKEKISFVPTKRDYENYDKVGLISIITDKDKTQATSRILINLEENLQHLDDTSVVFGEIVEGFETLNKINGSITDYEGLPIEDIRIKSIHVLENPFSNSSIELIECSTEARFPKKLLPHVKIDLIKDDEQTDLKKLKENEAKSQALTLEIIGDLPDADIKPSETVLFICKLNPITQEDDLKLIFSKFGTVKNCNIVKDKKTGKSLQYGFIDFKTKEDCEMAYMKMNNVIIDDRQVHVDFSQSVWDHKQIGKKRKFPQGSGKNKKLK